MHFVLIVCLLTSIRVYLQSESQNPNPVEVAMVVDVDMGVVVVLVAGTIETQPTMKTHMATGKYLPVMVHLMRLMLEKLLKGAVVAMVGPVVLTVVVVVVVTAMEKLEKGTILVDHWIAIAELDAGMLLHYFCCFVYIYIYLLLLVGFDRILHSLHLCTGMGLNGKELAGETGELRQMNWLSECLLVAEGHFSFNYCDGILSICLICTNGYLTVAG